MTDPSLLVLLSETHGIPTEQVCPPPPAPCSFQLTVPGRRAAQSARRSASPQAAFLKLALHGQAMAKLKEMEAAMVAYFEQHRAQASEGLVLLPGVSDLLPELKVRPWHEHLDYTDSTKDGARRACAVYVFIFAL